MTPPASKHLPSSKAWLGNIKTPFLLEKDGEPSPTWIHVAIGKSGLSWGVELAKAFVLSLQGCSVGVF